MKPTIVLLRNPPARGEIGRGHQPRQRLGRVVLVAGEILAEGLGHALRRVEQAFAVRVVAGPGEKGADGGLGLFLAGALHGLGRDLLDDGFHNQDFTFRITGQTCARGQAAPISWGRPRWQTAKRRFPATGEWARMLE